MRVASQPPDADNDCDVDLGDFGNGFALCFAGSNIPVSNECLGWDFDFDGDVDQGDFSVLSLNFTGAINECRWTETSMCSQLEMGPERGFGLEVLLEDPDIAAMYSDLKAYCEEQGIPFD